MYQVYSQQRPGRPHWALASSAVLLLLTVLLAAALIHYKAQASLVPLAKPQVLEEAGLRVALPEGWTPFKRDRIPEQVVICLREPDREGRLPRLIMILRAPGNDLAIPSYDARAAATSFVRRICPGRAEPVAYGRVGSFPGFTVKIDSPPRGDQLPAGCLCRVAVAPDGQLWGAAIMVTGAIDGADERLLDSVCAQLEPVDAKSSSDGTQAMTQAGIRFAPPGGVSFVAASPDDPPGLSMHGGSAENAWFLNVFRIALAPDRECAALVADTAMSLTQTTELQGEVPSETLNGRAVAGYGSRLMHGEPGALSIWCARTGPVTGLVLIGRGEAGAAAGLDQLCRAIVAEAEVEAIMTEEEFAAARRRGQEILASSGLDAPWSRLGKRPQVYLEKYPPGVITLREETLYRQLDDQWQIDTSADLISDGMEGELYRETWTLTPDGGEHTMRRRRLLRGLPAVDYAEHHARDTGYLERSLRVGRAPRRDQKLNIDKGFACEPLLLLAAADAAFDDQARPASCTTTETYPASLVHWMLTPLGERNLPEGAVPARAVRVQQDHLPASVIVYYGEHKEMLAISWDSGRYRILESAGPDRRRDPDGPNLIPGPDAEDEEVY